MDDPVTPKKQVLPTRLRQQPTPPPSMATSQEEGTSIVDDTYNPASPMRHHAYDALIADKCEKEHENSVSTLSNDDVKQSQDGQVSPEGGKQEIRTNDHPKTEIADWLYSASNPEQRDRRFANFVRGLWPSNDEFNAARHPFYDSEEDDSYDEFIKCREWDGVCPYDDDDYNPLTDPSRSTDVWEPKIGEDGIEDEQDLRMVLKGRQEFKDRSKVLKRLKNKVLTRFSLGLDTNYGNGEKVGGPESVARMEAPSVITNQSPPSQITTVAKGVVFFGDQEPSKDSRPQKPKNKKKKGRKSSKRKRGSKENPNSTYKYDSDSEDEQLTRKRSKNKVAPSDEQWKAQTRAAARRVGCMSLDGCYDADSDGSISTCTTGSTIESDEGEPPKKRLLSHTSFIRG